MYLNNKQQPDALYARLAKIRQYSQVVEDTVNEIDQEFRDTRIKSKASVLQDKISDLEQQLVDRDEQIAARDDSLTEQSEIISSLQEQLARFKKTSTPNRPAYCSKAAKRKPASQCSPSKAAAGGKKRSCADGWVDHDDYYNMECDEDDEEPEYLYVTFTAKRLEDFTDAFRDNSKPEDRMSKPTAIPRPTKAPRLEDDIAAQKHAAQRSYDPYAIDEFELAELEPDIRTRRLASKKGRRSKRQRVTRPEVDWEALIEPQEQNEVEDFLAPSGVRVNTQPYEHDDFVYKAVVDYPEANEINAYDSNELDEAIPIKAQADTLVARVNAVVQIWQKRDGSNWLVNLTRPGRRFGGPMCVTTLLSKAGHEWRDGCAGRYACGGCVKRGLPCFTWTGEDFWLLPLHDEDRVGSGNRRLGMRVWINE